MKTPLPPTLPTAQQVQTHLQRNPLRLPSRWTNLLPTLLLFAMVMLIMIETNIASLLLLWLAFMSVLIYNSVRLRAMRRLERQVLQLQEMILLSQHRQGLKLAWKALPRAAGSPMMHSQIIACIAQTLDEQRAYDAAVAAYDYLIEHLPSDAPAVVEFEIRRALAQLANDQLTLADATLRRLRNVMDQYADTPLEAAYHYAQLVQQIYTNRYDEAIQSAPQLIDQLRPLGTQAGFGYALMALAMCRQSPHDPRITTDVCETWWKRATLLLPVERLTARFDQLQELAAGSLPQTPRPMPASTGPAPLPLPGSERA